MRIAKRLAAIGLSLLVLMMNTARAEIPFLVFSNEWPWNSIPVEIMLKADVDTHMPFDEDRLGMLTPITDMLSLKLITGKDQGSVTIAMAEQEILTLQYNGNAVQLSSLPEITYVAEEAPLDILLGGTVSVAGGYEALGLDPRGETLLTDGITLLESVPSVLEAYGNKTKTDTNISGYGKSAYRYDYTVSAAKAGEVQSLLLTACPDGWLREIIGSMTFSNKQTLRMYYTEDDVLLRAEYNGTCGAEGDMRTVKLVIRTRQDEEMEKIFLELTSPAKTGKNKNDLTFERTVQTSKSGARTVEGNFNYTATKDGVTSIRKAVFDLKNTFTDSADVITGSITFQSKLKNAEKYTDIILKPVLTISGTEFAPSVTGTMTVTEAYAGKTTEHAVVSIDLAVSQGIAWEERESLVDLTNLDDQALAEHQRRAAASVATALVQPIIVMMGEEAAWFFRDLPLDAVQTTIETAEMTVY